ncbi:65-kDa microtubule-associated protein 3 [Quercus robur]|uniref:65-kDa microtubule-associated protein 3 n=1 Tax=Quercus robur TaxID=38942 RepID=UPI002163B3FC|nr:65-kDa microtubule-associated protein 3 [Quercus robur]
MSTHRIDQFAHIETTCGLLLDEMQKIWDEVGESEVNRDAMLLEIEQKCLEVYRRNVDEAKKCRAQLQQEIAESEAELADMCSAMGEQPLHFDCKPDGGFKKVLDTITLQLEDMRKRKIERTHQFVEVLHQIQDISIEFWEDNTVVLDETDLSIRRLEELRKHLLELQNHKRNRLKQVQDHLNTLNSLCLVLGMDFRHIAGEIHSTLKETDGTRDISDHTLEKLAATIQSLREIKIQRMQRLRDLASALLEMWNLMDTPMEEQQLFLNVTSNISASEPEITEPNMLSVIFLNHVEAEVVRLEQLKSSKMKELVIKKRLELEEICRRIHMVTETLSIMEDSVEAMESGAVDPIYLLEQIELQISSVKDEALCRKEILEKVEKWLAACQEESWLEEYNRDDNRYNAGRGAHLTLKHAEKARALVNKIPAMMEALTSKIKAWEEQRGTVFFYDGERLLSMLEQYSTLRQEKEQERQRLKDQKRLQGQLIVEQEALFGSKPSPSKSGKKASRTPTGVANNRKFSIGGAMLQNPKPEKAASRLHLSRRISEIPGHSVRKHSHSVPKAHENQLFLIRKPLSPVYSQVLSKANIANFPEDQKTSHIMSSQKPLPNSESLVRTPSKKIVVGDEENRTPKTMSIPMPTTPPTVSAPMTTAMTPTSPCVSVGKNSFRNSDQPIEYSFEEVRAGFILPKSYSH